MVTWHTRGARFTNEEIDIIEKYKQRHNLTDNQLIRQGVQFMVQFTAMKDLVSNESDLKLLKGLMKEVNKVAKSVAYKQGIDKAIETWARKNKEEELEKFEIALKEIETETNTFQQKRKRGRVSDKQKKNK